jgi:SAM-dependent methyltransferase
MVNDIEHYDRLAQHYASKGRRHRYYNARLAELFSFLVPENVRVLEVGCGDGALLAGLKPTTGVGVDISPGMVALAKKQNASCDFQIGDAAALKLKGEFDYVIMSDLIDVLPDVLPALQGAHAVMTPRSRIVLTHYNHLWEPFVRFGEFIGLKGKAPRHNWLSPTDVDNLLNLAGFEVVRRGRRMLLPVNVPVVSWFANRYLSELPLLRRLCFVNFVVARPKQQPLREKPTVSVIIPTWNEAGTIEAAVLKTPTMGKWTELVFIDNHSKDGTVEKIHEMMRKYGHDKNRRIVYQEQAPQKGKGVAVRQGFGIAKGDMLMILDSDLTMPAEDLPKYYDALVSGTADFANGCRLVYPMEDQSMRTLNHIANKFFSLAFSWLLDQPVKDTLCGTKVLWKKDYEKIVAGRKFFGDFDPFGDFDLLFGASKQNLKIVDVPIRYKARVYGDIKIQRWRHGVLLIRMCIYAYRKLKLH